MSSYGSQHGFPTQSPYSPYPQPNSTYFPPSTQQPPPPSGAIPMPIPQRPRQYSHSSHPPSSYGSHHSHSNSYNNTTNTYPPSPAQPFAYSTSPQMASSYLAPSDAAATSQAMTHQPAYTQTHSYQQQPLPPTMAVAHAAPPHYDRRSSHASQHSHRSRHHHHHDEDDAIDDSSRDTSTDSAEGRKYERAERRREHRPSVGEAVYRTFKYLGGLLDPKRA